MVQNQYPNQPGMPQQNGMNQWNRQNPYGNQYPQQNAPFPGQQNPMQGPMYPPQNGVNQQNRPQIPNTPQDPKSKKAAKKAEKKAFNKKKWITLSIFAVLGLTLGIIAYSLVNKYAKQMTIIELPGAPIIASTGNTVPVDEDDDGTVNQIDISDSLDLSQMTTQKGESWDGKNRITCLAMGLDYRDWVQNDGAPRSDSMMLLSYDPSTKYAAMLSIPRDLWVMIPDHGYGRINTAYSLGEGEQLPGVNGKPGGGAGLAMRTVELFLGVDIQYYAVIDFYGFIDFIDTIDKLAFGLLESAFFKFSALILKSWQATSSSSRSKLCSFLNSSITLLIMALSKSKPPRFLLPVVDRISTLVRLSDNLIMVISKVPPPTS